MTKVALDSSDLFRDWLLENLSFYQFTELEQLILKFRPEDWDKSLAHLTLDDFLSELQTLEKRGLAFKKRKKGDRSWIRVSLTRFPSILGGGRMPLWAHKMYLTLKYF